MPAGPEPETIDHSEGHVLPRSANGRDYRLSVALPDDYAASPDRRYPVIYVTDGYWDFKLMKSIVGGLLYDKSIPEVILVGIGYPGEAPDYGRLRRWDLTPVEDRRGDLSPGDSGHGAAFLEVIEHEIIPFVERRYRVSTSQRVLGGSSLGGLFALYVLFTKPALFTAYIAPSPAVPFANDWLFTQEEAFAKSGKPLAARLYMTGAERRSPASWPRSNASTRGFASTHIPGSPTSSGSSRESATRARSPRPSTAASASPSRRSRRCLNPDQSATDETSFRTCSNGITRVRSAFRRSASPSKSMRTSPRSGLPPLSLRRFASANFSVPQVTRMTFRSWLFVRGSRMEISRPLFETAVWPA